MSFFKRSLVPGVVLAAAMALGMPTPARAGIILAGTDADDHGDNGGGTNNDGWLFMQKVLDNLAPTTTNGKKWVVSLGSDPGTQAGTAAASAFALSSLPGLGWSFLSVNGVIPIHDFLTDSILLTTTLKDAGILMMDSGANVSGGSTAAEQQEFEDHATAIDSFLGAGGSLFSQSLQNYDFLSTLLPGPPAAAAIGESNTGISLTAAGTAAFPGLSNADLSAGPYHNRFVNFGSLAILGTSNATGNPIIIGASGGSITNPDPVPGVPAPPAIVLAGLGALSLCGYRMKRKPKAV